MLEHELPTGKDAWCLREQPQKLIASVEGSPPGCTSSGRRLWKSPRSGWPRPTCYSLLPYECRGPPWDAKEQHCTNCRAALREVPLQAAALPKLVRELRERYGARVGYGDQAPKIKQLHVAEVVPKRRIQNETDLEEALDALRSVVTEALGEVDTVEPG